MGATPIYAFPYAGTGDLPHGPDQLRALAEAVEAKIVLVDAAHAVVRDVPIGRFRQTATQTLATGTYASITLTGEDHDSHNGHSTSTNTSRYTVQSGWAGVYRLSGGVAIAANATGSRGTRWAKNGSAIAASATMLPTTPAGTASRIPAHTIQVSLAVGDYVELQAFQDSGGNLDTFSSGENASFVDIEFVRAL